MRLIGVDTPEVYGEVECYGREAAAFVKRLLPLGARVRYSLGVERRDRYGRALAYVYTCLLYTSPSPRDISGSRMPSSA